MYVGWHQFNKEMSLFNYDVLTALTLVCIDDSNEAALKASV